MRSSARATAPISALDSASAAPVVLEARGLSLGRAYRDVSLELRAGEVLGLYGFMGCGQIELVRSLFGKLQPDRGALLRVAGRETRLASTSAARRAGIAFVPESRRAMLFHAEPLYKNTSVSTLERISRFLLKPAREREIARPRSRSCRSGRRAPTRCSARFRAATSRRSRSRNG